MDSNLKASLMNLHASLAQTGPVDEELRELLQQLDGDIKTLLERAQEAPPGQSNTYGLAERTQELSAKFAAKRLFLVFTGGGQAPALRQVAYNLSDQALAAAP